MDRRKFISASLATSAAAVAQTSGTQANPGRLREYYQLRRYTLQSGPQAALTEKYISELVTAKTVYAKIDRPARVVNFAKPRDADDVLNEWSGNMKSLLGLLERIDHLITKEEMMARIQPTKTPQGSKAGKVH